MDSRFFEEPVPGDEYLEHYGVLGMKWGIRRYQPYPKGDGPKGRFIGEKAKGAASAVGRGMTGAARATKNRVVKAKQAYDAKAPEREAKRAEREAERWEHKVSSHKKKAYKNVGKLSDAELNARIDRLRREREFKSLTDDVVFPGKKRVAQYTDRVVNKVLDKSVDKAFEVVEKQLFPKSASEKALEDLKYRADVAKSQAAIAKSNATIAESNNKYRDAVGSGGSSKKDKSEAKEKAPKAEPAQPVSKPAPSASVPAQPKASSSSKSEPRESAERRAQLEEIQRHRTQNREIREAAVAKREAREARERQEQLDEIARHREENQRIRQAGIANANEHRREAVNAVSSMSRYQESGVSFASGHAATSYTYLDDMLKRR